MNGSMPQGVRAEGLQNLNLNANPKRHTTLNTVLALIPKHSHTRPQTLPHAHHPQGC